MNDRWGEPPYHLVRDASGGALSCVPLVAHIDDSAGTGQIQSPASPRRQTPRTAVRREAGIVRDALFEVWRDDAWHIVREDYSYKTEPYYTILRHELEGRPVRPSSAAILDAYIVPVCLEQARLSGIPVCEWRISQGYTPLPSILYGLNYFSTTSDYAVVSDNDKVKEVIKHITNKGKYPFCYQHLDDGAEVGTCIAVFGKTSGGCPGSAVIARQVYDLFAIPLVTLVTVSYGSRCLLSSLAPTKYCQLSGEERSLLSAYLARQEFL
jgi:hypothetical protein